MMEYLKEGEEEWWSEKKGAKEEEEGGVTEKGTETMT
jgi:hypothetical protein